MRKIRRLSLGLLAAFVVGTVASPQAFAQTSRPEDLNHPILQQRAVTAATWGMPIVSMNAMRQAFFRDARANYNDIVFWSKPSDWKNQTTTPNVTTRYVYFNFNTKGGPVVVEIPPAVEAGLFGSFLDAWQVPLADVGPAGEDEGKSGKYLLLPPAHGLHHRACSDLQRILAFAGHPEKYIRSRREQCHRAREEDANLSVGQRGSSARATLCGHGRQLFDGIARFDESYYASLAQMIN